MDKIIADFCQANKRKELERNNYTDGIITEELEVNSLDNHICLPGSA